MAKACCGVESGVNKDSFFNSTLWKLIVLFVGILLCVASYFWDDILGDAYSIGKYFNPAWIVVFVCGWPLAFGGFKNLFKYGKVRTSLLITVAMLACIALEILCLLGITDGTSHHGHNNLFSAGEVALIMWLGELLEDVTLKRSRKNLESLVKLTPTTARIKIGDQFIEMETQYVAIGDVVLVKPNETITVDGVVTSGITSVSQSAITGESVPVDKKVGDTVFAGTLNGNGAIEIEVTKLVQDSTLSKMISLVKQAENNKANIERTADKWAKVIVPSAIILSILVFFAVTFLFKEDWHVALTRAITILVVFCPCSLALATPTAIVAGMGNASAKGILIKSGSALESVAKSNVVIFDKTGTLSQNKLKVKKYFNNGITDEEFFLLCGSAESQSEHPLAKAIVEFCAQKTTLQTPKQTTSMVGVGVVSKINNREVIVAKPDYFNSLPEEVKSFVVDVMFEGLTVVCVAVDGAVMGAMGLSDVVNYGAKDAVDIIHKQNIETVMLTGDNEFVSTAVAKEVGINKFYYNLLPEQKLKKVSEYKQNGKTVCMVGDGVNDAPALASADIGIAMGAMGSDVAMEVADIVLLNDNVKNVGGIIRLGKRVLKTISANIIIGMSVNIVSVVLSLLGVLNPVLGALVHNVSSFLVVGNSAFLIGAKKPFKGCVEKSSKHRAIKNKNKQ